MLYGFIPTIKKNSSAEWTVTKLHSRGSAGNLLQWCGNYTSDVNRNSLLLRQICCINLFFTIVRSQCGFMITTTLKFLDVNQAAIDQYGYSRKEFLHMTITDIRPESEQKQFLGHLYSLKPVKVIR